MKSKLVRSFREVCKSYQKVEELYQLRLETYHKVMLHLVMPPFDSSKTQAHSIPTSTFGTQRNLENLKNDCQVLFNCIIMYGMQIRKNLNKKTIQTHTSLVIINLQTQCVQVSTYTSFNDFTHNLVLLIQCFVVYKPTISKS